MGVAIASIFSPGLAEEVNVLRRRSTSTNIPTGEQRPAINALRERFAPAPVVAGRAAIVLPLSVTFTFAIMMALFTYDWPQSDDYRWMSNVRSFGVIQSVIHVYFTWSGRWMAMLLHHAFHDTINPIWYYRVMLVAVVVSTAPLINLYVSAILETRFLANKSWCFTAVLLAMLWTGASAPSSIFYWLTASIENLLSVAMLLGNLALVIACVRAHSASRRRVLTITSGALSILVAGMHELVAMSQLYLLTLALCCLAAKKHPAKIEVAIILAVAFLGFLVCVLAPGNQVRAATVDHPGITYFIQTVVPAFELTVFSWITSLKLAAASFCLVALRNSGQVAPHWPTMIGTPIKFAVSLLLFANLAIMFGITLYAANELAGRALDAMYLQFLVSWFSAVLMWSPELAAWLARSGRACDTGVDLAKVLLGVGLLANYNTIAGVVDLTGPVQSFSAKLEARDKAIRLAVTEGRHNLVVEGFVKAGFPRLYAWNADVRADPSHFVNRYVAEYYGLETIRVVIPAEK